MEHTAVDRVLRTLEVGGTTVATLVDGGASPAAWSPRPFLHPVRTLAGTVLTDARPVDHPWHCGVGTAVPDVDGVNCWGGPTYVPGTGYEERDDHGRAVVTTTSVGDGTLTQDLRWTGSGGAVVLRETRTLTWDASGSGWVLGWTSAFRAPGSSPVRLGSPGSHGRAGAGYGGFTWRFAPCDDVAVRTPTAVGEDAVHGAVAPWVEWTGTFDGLHGPGARASVRFEALGHADPWFVRVAEYPAVGSALAWDAPAVVEPGAPLVRSFRVTVRDEA
ncbi:PmoA family protein [Curtobacterium sp. BH-2-1-1]|uniref:DUF6807 domain-containing protein n=1 Tax=Curtobacterium sp. BH-2-1-1 TaxID=1905847 RepID=UPI00164287AF|nr:PmoA family protein [Curtobacterium sp. BH-2-1-1]